MEFVDAAKLDFDGYVELSSVYNITCFGILGLISINDYTFLIIITKALEVGSPRPKDKIFQLLDVEFICLNSTDFDFVFNQLKYKQIREHELNQANGKDKKDKQDDEHGLPWHSVKKFLIKGNFYFANSFDLTSNLQNRDIMTSGSYHSVFNLNKKFLWNRLLIDELMQFRNRLGFDVRKKFDSSKFLTVAIRGFVQTINLSINLDTNNAPDRFMMNGLKKSEDSLLTLISKIAVDKSGKIFGPSGLDDEGNVANYIESEMIFYNENYCISYTSVRGNVPIYFEIDNQQSSSLLKKIQINRPFDATQEAFKKHFDSLFKTFGEVHILNEISSSISVEDIERHNNKKSKGIEYDMFKNYYEHYQKLIENPNYRDLLKLNNFNYTLANLVKNQVVASQLLGRIDNSICGYAALCYDNNRKMYLNKQSGVFRIASFDVMDKCNEIQKIIFKQVLLYALKETYSYISGTDEKTGEPKYKTYFSPLNEDLWTKLGYLWSGNNATINRILSKYNTELRQINKKGNIINNNLDLSSGTLDENDSELVPDNGYNYNNIETAGVVNTPPKKKSSLFNSFTDLTVSTSKKLFNLSNYRDLLNDLEKRNNLLLVLLGKTSIDYNGNVVKKVLLYDPINDYVTSELRKLSASYMSEKLISIFTGSFNVNGICYDGDLSSWLFPKENYPEDMALHAEDKLEFDKMPDMYFLGLQEIVELTAGQMMNVDITNRNFWERKILKAINNKIATADSNSNNKEETYILLWSDHLGGLLSLLYIKRQQAEFIKRIEESMKKTGLGGMAANKGGIAVSVQYSDTSFCFITSHLAAGLNNIEERHQNYKSLSTGLRFSGNRTIKSHDSIIWVGDFNYRIESSNEEVRQNIKDGKYNELFEYDQLNKQMQSGESFPYYEEFEIKFKPTYKFNNNEDTYDLSEKMRIPAWCDRIVNRGKNLRQLTYGSTYDIKFSDHRPVYGLFKANVIIINEQMKNKLSSELYVKRKAKFGNVSSFILSKNLEDVINKINKNTIDPDAINISLPPPSSDKQKWWFNNGMLARVDLFTNIANVKEFNELHNPEKGIHPEKNCEMVNPNGEFLYQDGMYINDKRPLNPFEFNGESDFVYPKEQFDISQQVGTSKYR